MSVGQPDELIHPLGVVAVAAATRSRASPLARKVTWSALFKSG
jgi:hypothetical protein